MPGQDRKAKITTSLIKRLRFDPDGAKTQYCWDTELTRFGVRIYPSNRKSFIVSYRHHRRFAIKTIGSCEVLTVAQAREKALKDLAGLLNDIDPMQEKKAIHSSMLFSAFAEMYLERYAKEHSKGWKSDESRIKNHLLPRFGTMPVIAITSGDVLNMHLEIGRSGHKGNANRVRRLLSAMFSKGKEWGILPENHKNPAKGRKYGSKRGSGIEDYPEVVRDRYVNKKELPVLIDAIGKEDIFASSAIWLYLLTGFRKDELIKATWDQIDLEQGLFILPDPKNTKPHYLPLSEAAKAVISNIPRISGNPYIFCGRKKGRPLYDIGSHWERVRKRTGFHDLRIHDLRHTIASWLVQAGNSLYLVGKILNHKDIRTTERYARFAQDDLKAALDQTGAQMFGIAGKSKPAEVVPLRKSGK